MSIEMAYESLFTGALVFMALFILVALFRCVRGPETCDRILAVNMIGTGVTVCILVLSLLLKETYLGDVALIYVLINFISVAILAKVYIPSKGEKQQHEEGEREDGVD